MISLRSVGTQKWEFTIGSKVHVMEGGIDACIGAAQAIYNQTNVKGNVLETNNKEPETMVEDVRNTSTETHERVWSFAQHRYVWKPKSPKLDQIRAEAGVIAGRLDGNA